MPSAYAARAGLSAHADTPFAPAYVLAQGNADTAG